MTRQPGASRRVLSLTESLNLFLKHLEIEGKSPETISWYMRRLSQLIVFTGDMPVRSKVEPWYYSTWQEE